MTASSLQSALGWRGDDFIERFHRYVSSDPHVAVDGTPLPIAMPPSALPRGSIDEVAAAVLAATRAPPEALQRRSHARDLFIQLAYRQGWRYPTELARLCNMHPDSVTRAARRQLPRTALHAATLCLADERLAAPNDSSACTHPSQVYLRPLRVGRTDTPLRGTG